MHVISQVEAMVACDVGGRSFVFSPAVHILTECWRGLCLCCIWTKLSAGAGSIRIHVVYVGGRNQRRDMMLLGV